VSDAHERAVPPKRRPRRARLIWWSLWAFAGLLIGMAAGVARPRLAGPVHYEMLIAYPILLGLSLWLIALLWRVPPRHAITDLGVGMTLLWGAFWGGIDGTMLVEGISRSTFSFVGFVIIHWLGGLVVGAVLLASARAYWPLREGPYCPGCGYCVIGVRERRCPECGRSFTLEELGVSAKELEP
jgi:hypothetical protein